jgi:hypothetical protein
MARRALVKNLKNHIGNSLMAINNVPYLLSVALSGTGWTRGENVRHRSRLICEFGVVSFATPSTPDISLHCANRSEGPLTL